MGNEACPKWNPQAEFISAEENSGFQGIFADGTRLFIPLFQLVEIPFRRSVSTKSIRQDGGDAVSHRLFLRLPLGKERWYEFCGNYEAVV
ncbi:MAG: hypothetical protein IKI88_05415 [Anaerotignum sp.]|nr:hypothetical protein [Anaerotignum sp.]